MEDFIFEQTGSLDCEECTRDSNIVVQTKSGRIQLVVHLTACEEINVGCYVIETFFDDVEQTLEFLRKRREMQSYFPDIEDNMLEELIDDLENLSA